MDLTAAEIGKEYLIQRIETEDEEVEFKPEAKTIGEGNLLVEGCQIELSAGLFVICAQCPDVSRIDKNC